jgi:hypothetical protein
MSVIVWSFLMTGLRLGLLHAQQEVLEAIRALRGFRLERKFKLNFGEEEF